MAEEEVAEEATITEDNAYPDWDKVAGELGLNDEEDVPESPDVSFSGEEEQPDSEVDETAPDSDETEVETEDVVPDAAQPEVDRAKRNLELRARVPKSILDKMDPAELTAWWDQLSTRETGVDKAFEELAEFKKTKPTEAAESVETVPTAAEELELPSEMAEELGESGAKALAGWIQKQIYPLRQQLAANEAANQTQQVRGVWDSMVSAGEFGDELPSSAFGDVAKQAVELNKIQGPWSSLQGEGRAQALFRVAAGIALPGTSPSVGETDNRQESDSARKNGTATRVSQRRKPKRQATKDEVMDAKLHAIVFGGETDGTKLKRKYGIG